MVGSAATVAWVRRRQAGRPRWAEGAVAGSRGRGVVAIAHQNGPPRMFHPQAMGQREMKRHNRGGVRLAWRKVKAAGRIARVFAAHGRCQYVHPTSPQPYNNTISRN